MLPYSSGGNPSNLVSQLSRPLLAKGWGQGLLSSAPRAGAPGSLFFWTNLGFCQSACARVTAQIRRDPRARGYLVSCPALQGCTGLFQAVPEGTKKARLPNYRLGDAFRLSHCRVVFVTDKPLWPA